MKIIHKKWLVSLTLVLILLLLYGFQISIHGNFAETTPKKLRPTLNSQRTDVVILLTMMRSGSSIVGSIFNERPNVTYFYEPLFPFRDQECDDKTRDESLKVLQHISECQSEHLPGLYRNSTRYNKDAECKKYGVCFAGRVGDKSIKFFSRDSSICTGITNGNHICPAPIDPVRLNKHCHKSLLVAMKVIYLCKLEWLMPLFEHPNNNLKVVHLVRDPRSSITSRARLRNYNIDYIRNLTNQYCGRLHTNLQFVDDVLSSQFGDKYLRIRYEDFVLNPIGHTVKIYDFVGIKMHMTVKNWLDEAMSKTNDVNLSKASPHGMKRNVKQVLNAWRREMAFEVVHEIQTKCKEVLRFLDYKIFQNKTQLTDLTQLYFSPNW